MNLQWSRDTALLLVPTGTGEDWFNKNEKNVNVTVEENPQNSPGIIPIRPQRIRSENNAIYPDFTDKVGALQ